MVAPVATVAPVVLVVAMIASVEIFAVVQEEVVLTVESNERRQ